MKLTTSLFYVLFKCVFGNSVIVQKKELSADAKKAMPDKTRREYIFKKVSTKTQILIQSEHLITNLLITSRNRVLLSILVIKDY